MRRAMTAFLMGLLVVGCSSPSQHQNNTPPAGPSEVRVVSALSPAVPAALEPVQPPSPAPSNSAPPSTPTDKTPPLTPAQLPPPSASPKPAPSPTPVKPAQSPAAADISGVSPVPLHTPPGPSEVCIKPDSDSALDIDLVSPGDGVIYRVKTGWVVARPAFQMWGVVKYPDRAAFDAARLHSERPNEWEITRTTPDGYQGHWENFYIAPAFFGIDRNQLRNPMKPEWGNPGWFILTVESRFGTGSPKLLHRPLWVYAYDQAQAQKYKYLEACYQSLEWK